MWGGPAPRRSRPARARTIANGRPEAAARAHLSWTFSRKTPTSEGPVSKKTKMRKLKARRKKANHGRKPNAGR